MGDIYSLGYTNSCMRINIDELLVQTLIITTYQYDILRVLTIVTQKLQVICTHFTHRMTVLRLELSIFCITAGCEK